MLTNDIEIIIMIRWDLLQTTTTKYDDWQF